MNIKDLLPSEGITDDVGANASSFESYKNLLAEKCDIDCNDAPEGWTNKLKHFVANRKDLFVTDIKKSKKISDAQKAFPLEEGESFYTRLMKNENADSNTKIYSPIAKQNSYISFSISESTNSQAENDKLVLSDEQRKIFMDAAPGDEKLEIKPKLGKKALARQKQQARDKTKGSGWFDMKAPEMTEEVKRDLEVLQMRNAIDPKKFYKKNDRNVLPKFFQIGQYVDGPLDRAFSNEKKSKKKSLVDELMADAEFKKYNKRKYTEIIEEKSKLQPKRFRGKAKSKKAK